MSHVIIFPIMQRFIPLLAAVLTAGIFIPWAIVSPAATVAAVTADPAPWKASTAKVSITPSEPVWMAGYAGRTGPSEGTLVDLFARALLLTDGHRRLVVVTMDLIEIPGPLRDRILEVASKNHGLKPDEVLLNVSHTHGGPMISAKTVADWGLDAAWGALAEKYVLELVAKIDGAIGAVMARPQDVRLSYAHARCGFAMNRRQPTPDGFRLGPNPDGPVDHDVPVLRIETPENRLIGLMFGYACHNTALGPTRLIHGDYAGFAQKKLEQDHPEAVALFLTGCGGDQDPAPRRDQTDAEQNGAALALAVEAALAAPPKPLDPRLAASLETCPLPFAPLPPRSDLQARAQSGDGFVSRHARSVLAQWPNETDHPPDYPLPVQVVQFGGQLTLVALGGEPVVDYSIQLKRELAQDGCAVWVAGYSNLVGAYIPNRRVLKEGGYEGTEAVIYQSLPGPFRPEVEDRIFESVRRQVTRVRASAASPPAPPH